MLGLSGTGVGTVVGGTWFLIDNGVGVYNYFTNDSFTTLSDKIDTYVAEEHGQIELYDGFY